MPPRPVLGSFVVSDHKKRCVLHSRLTMKVHIEFIEKLESRFFYTHFRQQHRFLYGLEEFLGRVGGYE